MVLAADYPFLDVFCTMILFFCWVAWIWMLIANGKGLTDRRVHDVQVSQANFDEHVRKVAADGGSAGEIGRAKELLDSGAINQTEYEQLNAKALA